MKRPRRAVNYKRNYNEDYNEDEGLVERPRKSNMLGFLRKKITESSKKNISTKKVYKWFNEWDMVYLDHKKEPNIINHLYFEELFKKRTIENIRMKRKEIVEMDKKLKENSLRPKNIVLSFGYIPMDINNEILSYLEMDDILELKSLSVGLYIILNRYCDNIKFLSLSHVKGRFFLYLTFKKGALNKSRIDNIFNCFRFLEELVLSTNTINSLSDDELMHLQKKLKEKKVKGIKICSLDKRTDDVIYYNNKLIFKEIVEPDSNWVYKSFKYYTTFDRFVIQTEMFEYYKDRPEIQKEILEDMGNFISVYVSIHNTSENSSNSKYQFDSGSYMERFNNRFIEFKKQK